MARNRFFLQDIEDSGQGKYYTYFVGSILCFYKIYEEIKNAQIRGSKSHCLIPPYKEELLLKLKCNLILINVSQI